MPRRDDDEEDDYDRRSVPRSSRPKRRRDDDDEEDDYDRRPDEPEPDTCPTCGCRRSSKISFTWWGGVVGPSMFNLVACRECGQQYNRKTGKAFGWVPIIVYSIVVGGAFLVLFAVLFGALLG
jgi:transcription elongation factor Elf1